MFTAEKNKERARKRENNEKAQTRAEKRAKDQNLIERETEEKEMSQFETAEVLATVDLFLSRRRWTLDVVTWKTFSFRSTKVWLVFLASFPRVEFHFFVVADLVHCKISLFLSIFCAKVSLFFVFQFSCLVVFSCLCSDFFDLFFFCFGFSILGPSFPLLPFFLLPFIFFLSCVASRSCRLLLSEFASQRPAAVAAAVKNLMWLLLEEDGSLKAPHLEGEDKD